MRDTEVYNKIKEALRGTWVSAHLDGRNEHGAHVLSLPANNVDVEPQDIEEMLDNGADDILDAASELGFVPGHAVVLDVRYVDVEYLSIYPEIEWTGINVLLTELLYGTPDEQNDQMMAEYPCPRCGGKGYHHGFGDDGIDPDWCTLCGGPGVVFDSTSGR